MAFDDPVADRSRNHTSWRHLIRHFAEMVVAMVVGMAVLGMAVRMILVLLGHSDVLDRTEVQVVVMSVNMAIGMSVWMRYRRHSWASVVEMDVAMIASFVVLLVPFWLGVLPDAAVMMVGHVLMLPVMALVMLRRRHEYVCAPSGVPQTSGGVSGGPVGPAGDPASPSTADRLSST